MCIRDRPAAARSAELEREAAVKGELARAAAGARAQGVASRVGALRSAAEDARRALERCARNEMGDMPEAGALAAEAEYLEATLETKQAVIAAAAAIIEPSRGVHVLLEIIAMIDAAAARRDADQMPEAAPLRERREEAFGATEAMLGALAPTEATATTPLPVARREANEKRLSLIHI